MSGTTSTDVKLPDIPPLASGGPTAVFVKGIRNNGAVSTAPQYVTFGHSFQKGELASGGGLSVDFGAGQVPCQVDVKTSYPDGSAAHAVLSVAVPAVAPGAITWGQFSVAAAPSGAALSLGAALGTNALSLTLTPTALPDWSAGMTPYYHPQSGLPSGIIAPTVGNAGGFIYQVTGQAFISAWAASAAIKAATYVQPATTINAGSYVYYATTAGTSGTAAPTWPQTLGATVTDGTVVWINIGTLGQTGSVEPTWPQTVGASVPDGTVVWTCQGTNVPATTIDLAALVKNAAADLWLNGPLAVQGRASQTISQALRIVEDVTAYADGSVSFDVMLANDITDVITQATERQQVRVGTLCYTAALTLNGAAAYTSPPLTHYLNQNWTMEVGTVPHLTNSSQENVLQIIHDPADFIDAQAAQSYDSSLGVAQKNFSWAQEFVSAAGFGQPLTNPDIGSGTLVTTYMEDPGGRPDIGIDDTFVCWWFVTQDPTFRQVAFECAKVNGAIPWHFHNAATGQPWTITDSPVLWIFGPSTSAPNPNVGNDQIAYTSQFTANPDWSLFSDHFPELIYLQYLSTGRRYFLDELNNTTNWVLLAQNQYVRFHGQGIFLRNTQVRSSAWTLRNVNYGIYANPDGSAEKAYLRLMLDNNLYWFLGMIQNYQARQGDIYGYFPTWAYGWAMANWEQMYLISGLTFSAVLGHPAALQICQWMGHYYTGLLTNGSNDPVSGLPPAQMTTYDLPMFPIPLELTKGNNPPMYSWGISWVPPLQTFAAIEEEMVNVLNMADTCVSQSGVVAWASGSLPSGGSNGDYSQLMCIGLTCLANIGVANAAEALNIMETQTAADGTTPPTLSLDDNGWAGAQATWRIVPHAVNDSQVITAPSAPNAYGTAFLGPMVATAGAVIAPPVTQPVQADTGEGGVTLPALFASGAASVPGYAALANALSAIEAALATL